MNEGLKIISYLPIIIARRRRRGTVIAISRRRWGIIASLGGRWRLVIPLLRRRIVILGRPGDFSQAAAEDSTQTAADGRSPPGVALVDQGPGNPSHHGPQPGSLGTLLGSTAAGEKQETRHHHTQTNHPIFAFHGIHLVKFWFKLFD
jgi:hypothetical protein